MVMNSHYIMKVSDVQLIHAKRHFNYSCIHACLYNNYYMMERIILFERSLILFCLNTQVGQCKFVSLIQGTMMIFSCSL